MTARNEITGDLIATKGVTDAYRDGWDRIFRAPPPPPPGPSPEQVARDQLTAEWHRFCAAGQTTLPCIPTFQEWLDGRA